MIKKFITTILKMFVIANVAFAINNSEDDGKNQFYGSVDAGVGVYYSFGNDRYFTMGSYSASICGMSKEKLSAKLYISGTYLTSKEMLDSKLTRKYIDPSVATKEMALWARRYVAPKGTVNIDGSNNVIGLNVEWGSGFKSQAFTGLIFFGKNTVIKQKDVSRSRQPNKHKVKCLDSIVNTYIVFGGTLEKINCKTFEIKKGWSWNESYAKEILFGIGFDGIFYSHLMMVIPQVNLLAQIEGFTEIRGTGNAGGVLNKIKLYRVIGPTILIDAHLIHGISRELFIGLTPFIRLNYRLMKDNFNVLSPDTPVTRLGDIFENNVNAGIEITLMYVDI